MRRRQIIALCAGLGCLPRVAFAQTGSMRHLAYVHAATPVSMLSYDGARASGNKAIPAFLDELRRSGFIEGQNLSVARYSGQGQTDRYAELAREVVASSPDAIFTMTARMVRYFKAFGLMTIVMV
jgi:putative tryptophan/tyrosine transport system substrate-binding protein